MFENLNPDDNDLISLGIAAGEESKQQKKQILKDEKGYKDLKWSQKFNLLMILLLIGLFVFGAALSIESLAVSGIIPGRNLKSAIVVRKGSELVSNSGKARRFYYVYWKEPNLETEQEKSISVPVEDWVTIQEGQKIQLVSRFLYKDWVILGTSKTSGVDLTIKLVACVLTGCLIFYFLRKSKSAKQEILEIESSMFKIGFN